MDDKEIQRKIEKLGKLANRSRLETERQAEYSRRALEERKRRFEEISAQIIQPSVEYLRTLAGKHHIPITVEACGLSHEGMMLKLGYKYRLSIMPCDEYSEIICQSLVMNLTGSGYRPDTTETWTLDEVTPQQVKKAILTFIEDAVQAGI